MIKTYNEPNIHLTDINIHINDYKSIKKETDSFVEELGTDIFIYLHNSDNTNGFIIENVWIHSLKIINNGFIPHIELIYTDKLFIINNFLQPDDNSIISIYKKSNNGKSLPIRMDFVITNFRTVDETNFSKIINLIGELNLYNNVTQNKSFKNSSFELLKSLSEKLNLGFVSNLNNTNDKMTWINPGLYITEFIPSIVKHSFKSKNSFLISYIDFYYNLNYLDIETQLNDDPYNNITYTNSTLTNNSEESKLILSNHPNLILTSMYIDKYVIINSARDINFKIGYSSHIYYYNKTTNSMLNTNVDTIVNTTDSYKNPLKSLNENLNYRKFNMGKMDEDNVHNNYTYSKKLNEINIDFLQRVKLNIILKNSNMDIYRFQLVELVIFDLKTPIGENNSKTDSDKINEKISGDWLITGINYIYKHGSLKQEVTLVKRELNYKFDKKKFEDLTKKIL
jgi:hypothetical protein